MLVGSISLTESAGAARGKQAPGKAAGRLAWPRLVITPKRAGRDSWKDAVNGIFGACPDFDTARTGDAPRKAAF